VEDSAASGTPRLSQQLTRFRIFYNAVQRLQRTDVSALAAETAYFSILAIAPFLFFLIAGIAMISQFVQFELINDLENTVQRMAPGDTGDLLVPIIEQAVERTDRGTLSFGMFSAMVVAMWSGSRAISSLIKGSARINGVDIDWSMIWTRLISLGLAAVMGAVLILSVAVFLFGRGLGRLMSEGVGMGDTFAVIWVYISWPLMAGIVLLMLSMFFWFATGRYTDRLRFISPGAVIATVLWMVVMIGLRVFLWIVDPGSLYGALGSFVVLVVFFYIMSLALLFGAAINAEIRYDPEVHDDEESDVILGTS
jgi:membrane protein